MRLKYDRTADAAYIYMADKISKGRVALTYTCDPNVVNGMINLDFDETGVLLGIEVLTASRILPPEALK
jgi:uncharacterized protein YuzE